MTAWIKLWNLIMVSACLTHLLIAWSLFVALLNPPPPTPAQEFLRQFFPDEVWPVLFTAAGVTAAAGLFNIHFARVHFAIGAGIMFLYGGLSLWLSPSLQTRSGGVLLLHFAVLKMAYVWYAPQLSRSYKRISRIVESVSRAQSVLEDRDVLPR